MQVGEFYLVSYSGRLRSIDTWFIIKALDGLTNKAYLKFKDGSSGWHTVKQGYTDFLMTDLEKLVWTGLDSNLL